MNYTISSEHHISPVVHHKGKTFPEIEFFYAIHRHDGSLLFRTEKLAFAEAIVARLDARDKVTVT